MEEETSNFRLDDDEETSNFRLDDDEETSNFQSDEEEKEGEEKEGEESNFKTDETLEMIEALEKSSKRLEQVEKDLASSRMENERLLKKIEEYCELPDDSVLRDECSKLKQELEELFERLQQSLLENQKLADESSKDLNDESKLRDENSELKKQLKVISDKLEQSEENLATFALGAEFMFDENAKLKTQLKESFDEHKRTEQDLAKSQVENARLKRLTFDKDMQNKLERLTELLGNPDLQDGRDLRRLLDQKEKERQELLKKNLEYQSALVRVINDEKNPSDSVQLKEDILALQKLLRSYVTTLKGNFEIDFDGIQELLKQHDITIKITPQEPNKPLVKAVLQFHVLNRIIEYATKFFQENQSSGTVFGLEALIVSKSKDLEETLVEFSNSRNESDVITRAASTKIRQGVNVALGNQGFSDILDGNDVSQEHTFIKCYKDLLNEEVNKYRIIKDLTKKESIENLASKLIRDFIRIIWFRLNVQEPSAQMKWVPIDSKIDPSIMEGVWDEEEIDDLIVDVCSFPIIGQNLDDVKKRRIYSHAQVLTKKK